MPTNISKNGSPPWGVRRLGVWLDQKHDDMLGELLSEAKETNVRATEAQVVWDLIAKAYGKR